MNDNRNDRLSAGNKAQGNASATPIGEPAETPETTEITAQAPQTGDASEETSAITEEVDLSEPPLFERLSKREQQLVREAHAAKEAAEEAAYQASLDPEERERRRLREEEGEREVQAFLAQHAASFQPHVGSLEMLQLSFEHPGALIELAPYQAAFLGAAEVGHAYSEEEPNGSRQGLSVEEARASCLNQPVEEESSANEALFEPDAPLYQRWHARLIEQIKERRAPWQRKWFDGGFLPYNGKTGRRYRGMALLVLMSAGFSNDDACWLTEAQCRAIENQPEIQPDQLEKGTQIPFFVYGETRPQRDRQGHTIDGLNGQPKTWFKQWPVPKLFHATLYNTAQMAFVPYGDAAMKPTPRPESYGTPEQRTQRLVSLCEVTLEPVRSAKAHYVVQNDVIRIGDAATFASERAYCQALIYALAQWTGHETRLKRDLASPAGSVGAAKEALICAFAAMLLGDELGIGHNPSQGESHWFAQVRLLQAAPHELWHVCREAEAIYNYVMDIEYEAWIAPIRDAYDPEMDDFEDDFGQTRQLVIPELAYRLTEHSKKAFDPTATVEERAFAKLQLLHETDGMAYIEMTDEEMDILGLDEL